MNLPVPVVFSMDGNVVVAGGTSRGARVLDSRTSETTQLLPHDGMFNLISVRLCNAQAHVQVILSKPLLVLSHDLAPPLLTTICF
jgi:hypothetical protein